MMEGSEGPWQSPPWWMNLSELDFNLTFANYSFESGLTVNNQTDQRFIQHDPKSIYFVCFLVLCCFTSLVVNILILSSVCFMRTRVNNILYISLSLAAADTFILFFLGLGLFIFTLCPYWGYKVNAPCVYLLLEGLRMGAIMTDMFHLVALGFNHYLGILLPLRLITRRNIQYLIVILWTVPSTLVLLDIFLLEANEKWCDNSFLQTSSFRMRLCIPFFTVLGLMVFIYVHIYHLVCIHQKQPLDWGHRHSSSQVTKKTIVTTIMILGSTILGWLPPFVFYFLFCDDCPLCEIWEKIKSNSTYLIAVTTTLQVLLILKPATNFYIYAFRMKEIRNAMRNMRRRAFLFLRHPKSGARFEMTEMSLTRVRSRTSTCRRDTHSMRINSSQEPTANGSSPGGSHQLRRGRSSMLSRHGSSKTSVL